MITSSDLFYLSSIFTYTTSRLLFHPYWLRIAKCWEPCLAAFFIAAVMLKQTNLTVLLALWHLRSFRPLVQ